MASSPTAATGRIFLIFPKSDQVIGVIGAGETLLGSAQEDSVLHVLSQSGGRSQAEAEHRIAMAIANGATLDGGAGSGVLTLSQGNIPTLGIGADHATIFDFTAQAADQAAVITDVNPAVCALRIVAGDVNGHGDHDGLVGQFSTQEIDGNTHVIVAAKVVSDLQGVTGLNIGLFSNPFDDTPICARPDGTSADSASFDVLVYVQGLRAISARVQLNTRLGCNSPDL